MKANEALEFIERHELGFVDLCTLVDAWSVKTNSSISWKGPRVTVIVRALKKPKVRKV